MNRTTAMVWMAIFREVQRKGRVAYINQERIGKAIGITPHQTNLNDLSTFLPV